jgi:hypothetical protein
MPLLRSSRENSKTIMPLDRTPFRLKLHGKLDPTAGRHRGLNAGGCSARTVIR